MATYTIKTDGHDYTATVIDRPGGGAQVTVEGQTFEVQSADVAAHPTPSVTPLALASAASPLAENATPAPVPAAPGGGAIVAPIPGKILSLEVKVGDSVQVNQVVLILEAMKMENNVPSAVSGRVKKILVGEGAEVTTGQTVMVIE